MAEATKLPLNRALLRAAMVSAGRVMVLSFQSLIWGVWKADDFGSGVCDADNGRPDSRSLAVPPRVTEKNRLIPKHNPVRRARGFRRINYAVVPTPPVVEEGGKKTGTQRSAGWHKPVEKGLRRLFEASSQCFDVSSMRLCVHVRNENAFAHLPFRVHCNNANHEIYA
ncbi:unnamed protein product [Pleuronectes platessa]|uniref:Uncharacterized protein n=1 Tax=Pleuronectes platessa TaxID=8262 RepID=A0A9N7YEV8_PLEPL|nr:unnamed protein product [Pleuronectes platessa]